MKANFTIAFSPSITREQAEATVKALEDYWKACGSKDFEVKWEETCRCKQKEGLRSTHCAFHGTCNCCHGATCPSHDEPERFQKVPDNYVW